MNIFGVIFFILVALRGIYKGMTKNKPASYKKMCRQELLLCTLHIFSLIGYFMTDVSTIIYLMIHAPYSSE